MEKRKEEIEEEHALLVLANIDLHQYVWSKLDELSIPQQRAILDSIIMLCDNPIQYFERLRDYFLWRTVLERSTNSQHPGNHNRDVERNSET